MKQKLSITLDEETVFGIQAHLRTGKFRNKSHVVEYAVMKLLEEENELQKLSKLKISLKENSQDEILLRGDLK